MSQKPVWPPTIGEALAAEGMLPPNCRNVEILMPADGIMVLRYECVIMPEDFPKIARAMVAMSAVIDKKAPTPPPSVEHTSSNKNH